MELYNYHKKLYNNISNLLIYIKNKYLFNILLINQKIFFTLFTPLLYLYSKKKKKKDNVYFISNEEHLKKTEKIRNKIIAKSQNKNCKIFTSRNVKEQISSRVSNAKNNGSKVNTEDLNKIIYIDYEKEMIKLEPRVSMKNISDIILDNGYTLPVIPELDDLTVGGLLMGCGIESSSFKYGLFQEICIEYEIITTFGNVLNVNKSNDPELFYSLPWSYGTLGILVSATLKMIKIPSKYIELTYKRTNPIDLQYNLKKLCSTNIDFIEAITYSKNLSIIIYGNYVIDCKNIVISKISKWNSQWYYKFVEKVDDNFRHTITLKEYYHRHSKSIFWELKYLQPFGNAFIFRNLLGWANPPDISVIKKCQPKWLLKYYSNNHVVQDYLIPLDKMNHFTSVCNKELNVYPIWICPYKIIGNDYLGLMSKKKSELYVDIGYYGLSKNKSFEMENSITKIEDLVIDLNGYIMLYAYNKLTKDKLQKMFDFNLYTNQRKKLKADNIFPEIYDKIIN